MRATLVAALLVLQVLWASRGALSSTLAERNGAALEDSNITLLEGSDEGFSHVRLESPFTYFGEQYDTVYVRVVSSVGHVVYRHVRC